jgi:hypothetical protein
LPYDVSGISDGVGSFLRDAMVLNIANKRVEEKAIQASRILGVNKTAAVESPGLLS